MRVGGRSEVLEGLVVGAIGRFGGSSHLDVRGAALCGPAGRWVVGDCRGEPALEPAPRQPCVVEEVADVLGCVDPVDTMAAVVVEPSCV